MCRRPGQWSAEMGEEGKMASGDRGIPWEKVCAILPVTIKTQLVKHRERFTTDLRKVWENSIFNFKIK